MSTDVFSSFGALDELIQVIYQSIYRFVAISTVSDDNWVIHLGLASSGRWWKATWSEGDVHSTLGSKASESILEKFAENVSELFVSGELYLGNANPAPQSNMKFTIGPATKKPISLDLEEMSSTDAAEFATNIFLDIALKAQSRKGRLHGGSLPYPAFTSASATAVASSSAAIPEPPSPKQASPHNLPRAEPEASSSRSTPVDTSTKASSSTSGPSKAAPKAAPAPLKRAAPPTPLAAQKAPAPRAKGASMLNPNKKARKYQAVEFDDEDDED
ncbi:hypothetical protein BKA70DRAFT_1261640 [Coprinopsis sp. MPI-PUGE-AT-0042]|nr:hypothetical protein BKA70DRAFT_1261640 [Coprinopsis sp. MPI-PUGE-AT-0042]